MIVLEYLRQWQYGSTSTKLLDCFYLEGPNGRRLCLAMPVVGPSVVHYAGA